MLLRSNLLGDIAYSNAAHHFSKVCTKRRFMRSSRQTATLSAASAEFDSKNNPPTSKHVLIMIPPRFVTRGLHVTDKMKKELEHYMAIEAGAPV